MTPIVAATIIFFAVAMAMVFVAMLWETLRDLRDRKALASRLESMDFNPHAAGPIPSNLLRPEAGTERFVEMVMGRFPKMRGVATLLEQADMAWSMQTFMLLTAGFAIGSGLAMLVVTKDFLLAGIAAAIGSGLPLLYVKRKRSRRLHLIEEQLPESIDLLGRALRAGHPFSSGVKMVADEIPRPLGEEFRRAFEEQRFGLPQQDVLLSLADRAPVLDVRIFVTAVLIQREVGGNLAEILDNIAYTVRERFRIRREIRTRTAQGRMTGYLLAALPIATGAAFYFLNRDYIGILFKDPLGHLFVGGALVLQVIGFFWIRKVVDVEI